MGTRVRREDEDDSRLRPGIRETTAASSAPRLAQGGEEEGEESLINKLLEFALTAKPLYGAGRALVDRFEESAVGEAIPGKASLPEYEELPAWARFTADTLLSPVGLASVALAPVSGGTSLGLRGAAGVAARGATRLLPEIGVSAAATGAGKLGESLLPEDAPGGLKLGVSLATGLLGGGAAAATLRVAQSAKVAREYAAAFSRDKAAEIGNTFVADAVPFNQLLGTVNVDRGKRAAFQNTFGLDKSKDLDPMERNIAALQRGYNVNDSQATLTVSAAIPESAKSVFDTDPQGFVKNVKGRVHHNDMMEFDDAPARFEFSDVQTSVWNRARQVISELRKVQDLHGIQRAEVTNPGRTHFPRAALSRRGVDFWKQSDPIETRLWGTAQEGAEVGGVVYDDIDSVLSNYAKNTYDAVLEREFFAEVSSTGITPFRAGRMTREGRVAQYKIIRAKERRKSLRAKVTAGKAEGKDTAELETRLAFWNNKLDEASAEWTAVKDKNFHTLPGEVFAKKGLKVGREGKGPLAQYDEVPVEVWKGKWYPRTEYKRLMEWTNSLGTGLHRPTAAKPMRTINDAANFMRFTAATADIAAPMIQGLTLFAHDPVAWSKVMARSTMALFNPRMQTRYIESNRNAMLDMIQNGRVPMADVEMFKAIQAGGIAEKSLIRSRAARRTGVSRVFRSFQASYDTALMMQRVELWKSIKPRWQGTDEQLGRVIRNATGGLETTGLNIGPNQRSAESLIFFAPRLMRSMLAYFGEAARPWTPDGMEAAHNLLRFSAAMAGIFSLANVAIGYNEGLTQEQVEQRVTESLNPLKGRQFLGVKVGDKWYGVGGSIRSTMQFVTRAITDPTSVVSEGAMDNPFTTYLQGRASPFASLALGGAELLTEEEHNILPFEYLDSPLDLGVITARGMLPFVLQSVLEHKSIGAPSLEFAGARTSTVTPYDILRDEARRRYNVEWEELTDKERTSITSDMPDVEKARDEFDAKSERLYREQTEEHTRIANETMLSAYSQVQTGQMTREQLRETISDALHDRFIANREAREKYGVDFGEPSTVRAKVLDAYYKTFEDAALAPGSGQIDVDAWEEARAVFLSRIDAGEFGPPAEAKRFFDERKVNELPEELQWFNDNRDIIASHKYWEIKDEVFQRFAGAVSDMDIESVNDLEDATNYAVETGDRGTFVRLKRLMNRIDAETNKRRERLRRANPDLERALRQNGHIETPTRQRFQV